MFRQALSLTLLLGLLAPTSRAEDEAQTGVESPRRCLGLQTIRSTRVLDDRTILFETTGNRIYVNRLPRRCAQLGFEKRFAYQVRLSQLCNTDIITVITNFGRGASCGLGLFEPYVAPEPVPDKPGEGVLEPIDDGA